MLRQLPLPFLDTRGSPPRLCTCVSPKSLGQEGVVGMCVSSHTGETRQNDTFLSLLKTPMRGQNPLAAVMESGAGESRRLLPGDGWADIGVHYCCPWKCVSPQELGMYVKRRRRRRQLPERGKRQGEPSECEYRKNKSVHDYSPTVLLAVTAFGAGPSP